MPLCMLHEHLADYDAWKKGFYAAVHAAELESAGITLEAVYRDADDPPSS